MKTESMNQYEKETGRLIYFDRNNNPDRDYIVWVEDRILKAEATIKFQHSIINNYIDREIDLQSQLTWRSAINEPPKNEGQQLCRWSWQDNCHFRHYDLRFGCGNVTEKEIKDLLWLPIPKEN